MTTGTSRAIACSNIALAKYWGKADAGRNLTAVPSLSLTLDGLRTFTRVTFDGSLARDEGTLDGQVLSGKPLARVSALLDRVRALAGTSRSARVESHNDFPTAAGLASSASGFAALALAATRAAGLELSLDEISSIARASSASAARSLFGGFVELGAGAERAARVAGPEHWPLRMLVAITVQGPKSVGSTDGMVHTAATSPYYASWLASAPGVFAEVRGAVLARDLERLGAAMEHSALAMHASMLAARPAVVYFAPASIAVLAAVRTLRERGTLAFATMDAGPHVKVLTSPGDADSVAAGLGEVAGVERVIVCAPGPDAHEATE